MGTDNIVKDSQNHQNIMFYDAMHAFYVDSEKTEHSYNRWDVNITGLSSGNFESLLARCLLEKCEKSISFEFKLIGDDVSVFVRLVHPDSVILWDGEKEILSAVKIEVSFEHQSTSEAIKCHRDISEKFLEISSRKPFSFLKL
jgi:hypothetical protein